MQPCGDAALDGDVAEVRAHAIGVLRGRAAVSALLASVEDHLAEAGGDAEVRAEEVDELLPLAREKIDGWEVGLLRAGGAAGEDDRDRHRVGRKIGDEDVRHEQSARSGCVTTDRKVDLVGGPEIGSHRADGDESDRCGNAELLELKH